MPMQPLTEPRSDVRAPAEGPVVVAVEARRAEAENQADDALRVLDGEAEPHRPAFRHTEEHGALAARPVQDGGDVEDPLVHRRDLGDRIGEAGPALVPQPDPRPGRKPLEHAARARHLPRLLDVGHPAGDEHDRGSWPVTDDLEGDVRAVGRDRATPSTVTAKVPSRLT